MTATNNGSEVIDTTAVESAPSTALAVAAPSMIRPVGSMAEIVEAWEEFGRVKKALLQEADYQAIKGRTFVKKSGWRKIAAAFGISLELRAEHRETLDGGAWGWEVVCRAIAPNGRFSDGTASCFSNERVFSHPQHDVRAQAYTRAANRAISDLVGGGEVSADEMRDEETAPPTKRAVAPARTVYGVTAEEVHATVHEPIGEDSDLCTAIVDEMERTQTDLGRIRNKYAIQSIGELTHANAQELLGVLRRVKDKRPITEATASEII